MFRNSKKIEKNKRYEMAFNFYRTKLASVEDYLKSKSFHLR